MRLKRYKKTGKNQEVSFSCVPSNEAEYPKMSDFSSSDEETYESDDSRSSDHVDPFWRGTPRERHLTAALNNSKQRQTGQLTTVQEVNLNVGSVESQVKKIDALRGVSYRDTRERKSLMNKLAWNRRALNRTKETFKRAG